MTIGLYFTRIVIPNEPISYYLSSRMSDALRNKINNSQRSIDKWRHLLSDLFIKNVLSKELQIPSGVLKIQYDQYGKPFVVSHDKYFNVSSSHEMIVLATDAAPIGVDVEYMQPLNDMNDIVQSFDEEEQQMYFSKSKREQVEFFYKLWTLKESYLKAIGKGLTLSLQSFSIMINGNKPHLTKCMDGDTAWYFQSYDLEKDYQCAVCSRHNKFPLKANHVTNNFLLKQVSW